MLKNFETWFVVYIGHMLNFRSEIVITDIH